MPSLEELAFAAEHDVGRMNAFFPILPQLGNMWAAIRPWEGHTLALNLHITTLSAALLRELVLGGAKCVVSAANMGTTDAGTVRMLRTQGIEVYTGGDMEDRHQQVLDHSPSLLIDVGFDLIETCLDRRPDIHSALTGAVSLTRSGITRLRQRERVPFPVVNLNDGLLKDAVEHRHGVGSAIWHAVAEHTGMHLAGRRLAVIGYGPVGHGVAAYARAYGMAVEVVEVDPIRRLFAHYDGFPTPSLADAMSRVQLAVTATGVAKALTLDDLANARDGLVLLNAGQGRDEVDVDAIRAAAERVDHIRDHVVRYRMEDGRRLTVLAEGQPANIVFNSGSPEPVLLHFALVGLTLEWMVVAELAAGELLVPETLESRAAQLALQALNVPGN